MNTNKSCPHCGKLGCKGSCLWDTIKNDLEKANNIIEQTLMLCECGDGITVAEAFQAVCPDLHKMGYTFEMIWDSAKMMREAMEEIR